MRLFGIVVGALAIALSNGTYAQSWISYLSVEDRFAIGFPTEPVIEDTEWTDENGNIRPARRYTSERNGNRYSMIAVDYSDLDDRFLDSAFAHATVVYRQKGEVTLEAESTIDRIEGRQLQITLNGGRRLFFAAYFHDGRLYILDAEVSARSAPPGQFQQNLQFVDSEGARVRYTHEGERQIRTDDLQDALGGPDLDGPILEGGSDEYIYD
jgi:hypothetical protein